MIGPPHFDGIELVRVRLPLVEPWITSLGIITVREVTLVRAVVGGHEGWGECVAQPDPTYSAEYADGALQVLRTHLIPRAISVSPVSPDGPAGVVTREVASAMAPIKGHPMAKAAVEQAVLDAELRVAGCSLADHLRGLSGVAAPKPPACHRTRPAPPAPRTVPAGAVVGLAGSLEALLAEVDRRVEEGYLRVKLKIHPGWDAGPVAAVRERHGPHLLLLADANASYAGHPDPAAALAPLDRDGLLCIEQPLADDDLVGHASLAAALATPVCLDEAITSANTVVTALALRSCGMVNVKPSRVGGLLEAVRVHDLCAARGVPVWCGGMLETGVGRAANLALASLPNFTIPGDLSASGRFWAADVVTHPARLNADGSIDVPTGPGIGVTVRADLSEAGEVVGREWWPAPRR